MSYQIGEECLACSACEAVCPNDAISEEGAIYVIAPDKCTECVGASDTPQCEAICGIGAPVPNPGHRESHEQLLAKWQRLHPGETPKSG